jgi:hypothetical protein
MVGGWKVVVAEKRSVVSCLEGVENIDRKRS